MKSIRFGDSRISELPREQLVKRMKAVIREELTELQRYTVVAYYFENRTLTEIAEERGINKSTVCRTLKRAEAIPQDSAQLSHNVSKTLDVVIQT